MTHSDSTFKVPRRIQPMCLGMLLPGALHQGPRLVDDGPQCRSCSRGAGLPRLIREYNKSFLRESDLRLEDPDHTLAIPCFTP